MPQPYAQLWLNGPKVHATRTFQTSHRGWLLVHASKTLARPSPQVAALCSIRFGADWRKELARGAIIGAIYLGGCEPTGMARKHTLHEDLICGNFAPGLWAWRRTGATILLAKPVPVRGMPGLFEVDPKLVPDVPSK